MKKVYIREKAFVAHLAANVLRAKNMAIVFNSTIYLYNAGCDELMTNQRWLRHEVKHVAQYSRYGMPKFIGLYLLYSFKYGYYNNPLEIEARAAEQDTELLKDYTFHNK